jgi:hypothetical protein
MFSRSAFFPLRRGVTPDGAGENVLGKLLMERRDELAALANTAAPPAPATAVPAAQAAQAPSPAARTPARRAAAPSAKRQKGEQAPAPAVAAVPKTEAAAE